MQTRQLVILTVVNSVLITWLVFVHSDFILPGYGNKGLVHNNDRAKSERESEVEKGQKEKIGSGVEVMSVLRKLQASQVKALLNLNVDSMDNQQAMERFYHEVSTPVQGVCHSLKRFGGRWQANEQAVDGDKFICMDSYTARDCLVYSFGIRDDWGFEDLMDSLNCTVHAHDPTVSFPPTRGRRTHFHKLGVAEARDTRAGMETLKTLLVANGHDKDKVFYLKVDIEGSELGALPEWIESGALEKVEQLAMELHLPVIHQQSRFQWLLKVLQQLYRIGFRCISHEVNMTVKNQSGTLGYHAFLEVVFMKDSVWSFLDQALVDQ